MSAKGFGSLMMASGIATAALGCYLVSLKVASERAKLEAVETQIVLAERDIRVLETEIGTRGRLAQLERWNVNFIRLSAPSADQILQGGFQLATLIKPPVKNSIDVPVVLASASADHAMKRPMTDDVSEASSGATVPVRGQEAEGSRRPDQMMHVAGYEIPERPVATAKRTTAPAKPQKQDAALEKALKPSAKPSVSTSGKKIAAADPLAPLSTGKAAGKPRASGDAKVLSAPVKSKEAGSRQ